MKQMLVILAAVSIAACGVETTTTAATAAALKQQEVEQGRKTMNQFRQKVDAATEQLRQHAETEREAAENN